MTTRELPQDEWSRLEGLPVAEALAVAVPRSARVIVVEDEGQIIGCWALFGVWHAEGVWVAPSHRGKTAVQRRLWTGLRTLARALGVTGVWTGADSPDVASLLEKHGATKIKADSFVFSVR